MNASFVDVNCAVPYCGQLIARAAVGSVVESKCHRCYAITLWNNGKATITRSPKRFKDPSGKWRTIEDFDAIDRVMREAVAVESINVRSPRGR